MMHDEADKQRVNASGYVIHHDTETAVQTLKLTHRRRLENIEEPEKHKGQHDVADVGWGEQQCCKLPRDLINVDMSGVLPAAFDTSPNEF